MIVESKRELKKIIEAAQDAGKSVLVKKGVFDIVHPGHVHAIGKFSRYADITVILVMSDALVKIKKGDCRPINGQRQRAGVIDGIRGVDYVFLDKSKSREEYLCLLEFLVPDVVVITKSDEKKTRDYSGRSWKLVELPDRAGPEFSTTAIIDRVLDKYGRDAMDGKR